MEQRNLANVRPLFKLSENFHATFSDRKRSFLKSSDLLPLSVLIGIGLQALVLLLVLGNSLGLMSLARKPAPALVQMVDGTSIAKFSR